MKIASGMLMIAACVLAAPAARAQDDKQELKKKLLDEISKLTTAAMGIAQAAGEEAKAAFRSQTDRLVAEMDLVRREDHDALKAEVAALRAELEALRPAAKSDKAAKPAAKSGAKAAPKASKPS